MAFETGKRDLLSKELRDIFGMPAPPPPIVVRRRCARLPSRRHPCVPLLPATPASSAPIDCSKGVQPLTARSVTLQDDLTEELGADQGAEADGADAADDDDNAGEQG